MVELIELARGLMGEGALGLLIDAALKGTVLLALAAALNLMLRRACASLRHLVWSLAFGTVLLLPVLTPLLPHWSVPLVPRIESARVAAAVAPAVAVSDLPEIAPAASSESRSQAAAESVIRGQPAAEAASDGAVEPAPGSAVLSAPPRRALPLTAWVALVWLAGAVIVFVGILAGVARTWYLAGRSRPLTSGRLAEAVARLSAELGIERRVAVLSCESRCMPMTWGTSWPFILLPAEAERWSDGLLRAVLLHELAHVKRLDYLTQLIARVACALHWFNPLAWMAARRLRVERELACDDLVLRSGSRATDYASHLLDIALTLRPRPFTMLATVPMARRSQLSGRVRAVLDSRRRRGALTARAASLMSVSAALVALPIAAAAPGPSATVGPEGAEPTALESEEAGNIETPSPLQVLPNPEVARPGSMAVQSAALCDWEASGGTSSTWMDVDDDRMQLKISRDNCELEVDLNGEVTFTDDEADIASLSAGGDLEIEETRGRSSRRLVVEAGSGGALERTWYVDRREQPFDAAARAWLGDIILVLFRRAGLQATERAERILARHGVEGLLEEIEQIPSDYTAGRYYAVLLSQPDLDPETVRRVVRQAAREIDSDYELARILITVAESQPLDESVQAAYVEAAGSIDSDYEQKRVLATILDREGLSPEVAQAMLRSATQISSDYELASLLVGLVESGKLDDGVTEDFFRAVATIDSDYEQRRVIDAALKQGWRDQRFLDQALQAAREIGSDYELAQLLIDVADLYPLERQIPAAYLAAAGSIDSDYELSRVLTKLVERGELSSASLAAALELALAISSDHELSGLLRRIARDYDLDEATRPAYFRAVGTLDSDFELAHVLASLLESEPLVEEDVAAVLEAALEISSDYEMSSLLVKVARSYPVSDRLRPAFMRAVDTIDSRYERDRVLRALGSEA